jgi:hypothetical protein
MATNSLSLIDLNDYLGPSQLCTKPNIPTQQQQAPLSRTQIQLDAHPPVAEPLPRAQITLNDCLACRSVHCSTSSTIGEKETHLLLPSVSVAV